MKKIYLIFIVVLLFFSCKKTDKTDPPVTEISISALRCEYGVVNATPVAGIPVSGTLMIPYSGGSGVAYPEGTAVASTGVAGLNAQLQAGTLGTSGGILTFSLSGTALSSGVAYIPLNFGGQSCEIAVNVTVPIQEFTQYGTPFAHVPDRPDAVIYQVNMRTFGPQSNFQSVIARLDSIKALGVNVIYLMPIFPIGNLNAVNSPYCVKDYKAVNSEFGTLTDLRALVDGAHNRNMCVILDWVANHTSWDNAWISAHKEWYLQDGNGNILSPPGMGWNDVAQLNFDINSMRLEMIKKMKYWVYTANVDGFRCDYADGPPFSFWKQAIDSLRAISTHKLLLLAEGNRSNHYSAGFDFIFGFTFYGSMKSIFASNQSVSALDNANTSEFLNATNEQQCVRYLNNHDVNSSDGTPLDLFGGVNGSLSAFAVTALMKGIPMIYNGQEVGFPNRLYFPFTSTDITWNQNPGITAEYKKLIAFRNSSNAIKRGILTSYSSSDICAFVKEIGTEKVLVLANLRNTVVNYSVPSAIANTTWTNVFTNSSISLSTTLTLPAYSYLVLKN